jgi:two-component system NtrC family sensor kinase
MTSDHRRMMFELQTINDVADRIAHSLELDDVLAGAMDRLMAALNVQAIAVRLKDEATGAFELAALLGETTIRSMWTVNGGAHPRPSEQVIATGRSVVIDDLGQHLPRDEADGLPVRSTIAVPMIVADELVGTLSVCDAAPRRFDAAHERLLSTIAGQIGVAVQNARLHAAVRRAKREWEQTFDAIGDPIGVFDATGRLLRGNGALAHHLRRDLTELPGLTCREVGFCGGGCPACAVGQATAAPGEVEITHPGGQIFCVTTFPMGTGSAGAAVVQLAKNVTEERVGARRLQVMSNEVASANRQVMAALVKLKNTQAQLLQAEKLSAIGQLVAGVAHELNNPLTSVIGYAQLLEEDLARGDAPASTPEAVAADLRRIIEEAERAARIVRNLLGFARRQAASRTLHHAQDLFEGVLALREFALRSSGVSLEREFATELPPIMVDGNQLQQALLNLVLNSEQAMRGGPLRRLRVGARFVEDAAAVELFVGDTGHGITAAALPRIFDPFFTTRDVGEGTGLGLSICYGIVRDHGGDLVVESREGEGTTLTLRLPARVESEPVGARILVAHGEGAEHEAIAAALDAWGYQVTMVASSAAALDQYRAGRCQALLVDTRIIAGDRAGWQSARDADAAATPLIMLGRSDDVRVGNFGVAEAAAMLTPPFQLRGLRSAMRAVFQESA